MKAKACRLCGRLQSKHFCDTVTAGNTLTCKVLRANQLQADRKTRERQMAAELNGGVALGSGNKDLMARLAPLVIRSYAEVGAEMQLSPQAVRVIELKAISKLRRLLMPFRNAQCGADKVKQITEPVASLSD